MNHGPTIEAAIRLASCYLPNTPDRERLITALESLPVAGWTRERPKEVEALYALSISGWPVDVISIQRNGMFWVARRFNGSEQSLGSFSQEAMFLPLTPLIPTPPKEGV